MSLALDITGSWLLSLGSWYHWLLALETNLLVDIHLYDINIVFKILGKCFKIPEKFPGENLTSLNRVRACPRVPARSRETSPQELFKSCSRVLDKVFKSS